MSKKSRHFSLPKPIISYIVENPSCLPVYRKLIQIWDDNPIIVLSCLHYTDEGWKTCTFTRKKCVFEDKDMRKFDLEQIPHKVGIKDVFDLCSFKTFTPPSYFAKLHRCEATTCKLYRQSLTMNQFLFMASSSVECVLNECTIKNTKYSAPLPLENIVANLPRLQKLRVDFIPNASNLSSTTVKELLKLPHFSNIKTLTFHNASELLDIDTLLAYLKGTNDVLLDLRFCKPLSYDFKNHLDEWMDDLLASPRSNYRTPYLSYPGQNRNKSTFLKERFLKDHSQLFEMRMP